MSQICVLRGLNTTSISLALENYSVGQFVNSALTSQSYVSVTLPGAQHVVYAKSHVVSW